MSDAVRSPLARHLQASPSCRRDSSSFQSGALRGACSCGWMYDDDGPVSKRLFVVGLTLSEDSSSAGRVVDEVSSAGYPRVAVSRSGAEWVMRTEPKKPDRAARDDGPLDALISRYQACVWNVLAMFDGDPLPADDPSHFCIERLEALIRRGLIGPKGALHDADPNQVVIEVPDRQPDHTWGAWKTTAAYAGTQLAAMHATDWNDHVSFSPECGARAVDTGTVGWIISGKLSCDCGWRARHTKKDEDEAKAEEARWESG